MLRGRCQAALWLALALGSLLAWEGQKLAVTPLDQPADPVTRSTVSLPLESTGWLERAAEVPPHIQAAAARVGLDPALVAAVIEVESGRDPRAVSPRGAVGLMQVLPETGALMGLEEVADPAVNLEAGCRYLAALLQQFGGDVELALAAYNAGPGAVQRWGTIPPYRETRTFVQRVAAAYREFTGLELEAVERVAAGPSGLL